MEFSREAILSRMNELNMTQKELAVIMGGSQANMSRLLLNIGKVKTRDKTIIKLEQALKVKFGQGPIEESKKDLFTYINEVFNTRTDIDEITIKSNNTSFTIRR